MSRLLSGLVILAFALPAESLQAQDSPVSAPPPPASSERRYSIGLLPALDYSADKGFGYGVYDLQTVDPWFERSRHAHDDPEIRGAVSGVITFHFDDFPITIEAGDILMIPGGLPHEVITHNGQPFTAYKGSTSGERRVTELA